jgi:plasmid maintenance system killer protein
MRRFRFHSLRGEAKRWSLRVTGGLRITFGWSDEEAQDIDFENYQ